MTTAVRADLPEAPATVDADLWTRIRQRYLHYWEGQSNLWHGSTFLGVKVEKLPTDAWMYQELISRVRPDLLIETGTLAGGSAFFFARIMDLIGHGEILSIDVNEWPIERLAPYLGADPRPKHPRITYLTASSTSDEAITTVMRNCGLRKWPITVMVVLDSDHSEAHVRRELELYAQFVTPGSYLVVEDTGLTEATNPGAGHAFGAYEALAAWLPDHPEFEVDPACERFLLTAHPGGWLKRVR